MWLHTVAWICGMDLKHEINCLDGQRDLTFIGNHTSGTQYAAIQVKGLSISQKNSYQWSQLCIC